MDRLVREPLRLEGWKKRVMRSGLPGHIIIMKNALREGNGYGWEHQVVA